jgi:hypothetical protein
MKICKDAKIMIGDIKMEHGFVEITFVVKTGDHEQRFSKSILLSPSRKSCMEELDYAWECAEDNVISWMLSIKAADSYKGLIGKPYFPKNIRKEEN